LVEGDGREVAAGDHELQGVGSAPARPRFDGVDEEATGAGAAVLGRDPHGHELGILRFLFFEEGDGDAAVLVLVCEVADRAWRAEIGGALQPVGVGELQFAGVGAAEGGGGVLESTKADCFVTEGQGWGDLVKSDHADGFGGLVSSGGAFAGLHLFEEPNDADAEEAEQREPAEDVNKGPVGGLAAQLLIHRRLGGGKGVGSAEGAATWATTTEVALKGLELILELLAGARDGVDDLILVDSAAAGQERLRDGDTDGAADVAHEVEQAAGVADLFVVECAVGSGANGNEDKAEAEASDEDG
jgi:hypothetical protein